MEQNQPVFPSLSDSTLRQLGLWLQSNSENKEPLMADDDIENKYTSLVLAFKTDRLTLSRRLELQQKLRDQAEINMTKEIETLKSGIQLLDTFCNDAEKTELFEKIRQQVETLYKSTLRVTCTSELYGAVQQENRLSKAVDIILNHVNNLKQMYEKEKAEHEETRKLLKENKALPQAVVNLKTNGKRRASIATLHQGQNLTDTANTASDRRGSSSRRGSHVRRSGISKNDTQNDKASGSDEGQLNKICEQGRCGPNGNQLLQRLENCDSSCGSHQNSSEGETESDDEFGGYKQTEAKPEQEVKNKLPQRYKFGKRCSFCAPPWIIKIMGYLHWLQPYENYALHARYFLAGVLVFLAVAIVSASFFVPQESKRQ